MLGSTLVRVIDLDGKMRPELHPYNKIIQSLDPKQHRLIRISSDSTDSNIRKKEKTVASTPLFRITTLAKLNEAAEADRKSQLRNRLSTRQKTIQLGTSIGPADLTRKIEHLCGPAVLGRAMRARIVVEPKGELARSLAIIQEKPDNDQQQQQQSSRRISVGGHPSDMRYMLMQRVLEMIQSSLPPGDLTLISKPCLEGSNLVAIVASASAVPPPCRPKRSTDQSKEDDDH